jgi:hypothetical protein
MRAALSADLAITDFLNGKCVYTCLPVYRSLVCLSSMTVIPYFDGVGQRSALATGLRTTVMGRAAIRLKHQDHGGTRARDLFSSLERASR